MYDFCIRGVRFGPPATVGRQWRRAVEHALERRTIQWEAALSERAAAAAAGAAAEQTRSAHAAELAALLQDRNDHLADALGAAEAQLLQLAAAQHGAASVAAGAQGDARRLRRRVAEAEAAAVVAAAGARAASMEAFGETPSCVLQCWLLKQTDKAFCLPW